MEIHPDAKSLVEDYTREAARRSGLPEPARSEGRIELQSHLVESATAKAKDDRAKKVMRNHAREAIAALGTQAEVDAAFFADHRTDQQEAGWGRRWGAILIDFLIVGIAIAAVAVPFSVNSGPCGVDGLTKCEYQFAGAGPCFTFAFRSHYEGPSEAVAQAKSREGLNPIACVASILIPLVYFIAMEAALGRTIGKMAVGARVVRNDGAALDFGQAVGRNVVKAFGFLLLLDWFIGMLAFKPTRLRLSDKAAGTRVVLAH